MFDFDPIKKQPEDRVDISEVPNVDLPQSVLINPGEIYNTNISGYEWIVIYFRQYLDSTMQGNPLDIESDEVNQQYLRINQYELRVDSPLSPNQDSNTKEMSMTGSAHIYPGMKPIAGDMFIATTGDGESTLFTVTDPRRLSNNNNSAYLIEYRAVTVLDDIYEEALKRRTSKTVYFNKTFIDMGKNPFLEEEEHFSYLNILDLKDQIATFYFSKFYNDEYDLFTLPDCKEDIVDTYLLEFMNKIIPKAKYMQYRKLDMVNNYGVTRDKVRTLLDYLLDPKAIYNIYSKMKFKSMASLESWYTMNNYGIHQSNLDYCIELLDKNDEDPLPIEFEENETNTSLKKRKEIDLTDFNAGKYKGTATIARPVEFNHYIFSNNFYSQNYSEMSIVEKMVFNAINEESIGIKDLLLIVNYYFNEETDINKFYILPILYRLLDLSLGELN